MTYQGTRASNGVFQGPVMVLTKYNEISKMETKPKDSIALCRACYLGGCFARAWVRMTLLDSECECVKDCEYHGAMR